MDVISINFGNLKIFAEGIGQLEISLGIRTLIYS